MGLSRVVPSSLSQRGLLLWGQKGTSGKWQVPCAWNRQLGLWLQMMGILQAQWKAADGQQLRPPWKASLWPSEGSWGMNPWEQPQAGPGGNWGEYPFWG